MKHLIKNTFIWFIIIGTISWAVAFLMGTTTPTFINTYTVQYGTFTKTLYYLDVHNYLLALEKNVQIPIKEMFYDMPKMAVYKWSDVANPTFFPRLVANLGIWWINELMWWFNITLIVPLKLAFQPIILILTLLGIDLEQYSIITIVYKLYAITPQSFEIPYLP